ncbi:TPA: hypothetical protein ACGO7O_000172 [Streptococcus suis]
MKKPFIYILNSLALLPVISLVSLLIFVILIFLVTLIPSNILVISPQWIVEIILEISLILYGRRLNKLINKRLYKRIYWVSLVITFLIFLLWKYRFVTLLQSIILTIYCVCFERRFQNVKEFSQKANQTLFWLNIFDIAYIFIWFWISQIKEMSDGLAIFWIITLWIAMPIARTFILNVYIRQNKKIKIKGQTYLLNFIEFSITSFIQLFLYSYPLINSNELSIYILLFPLLATISYIFLNSLFKKIDDGPEKVVVVFLKILSFMAMVVIIIVLHLFENDFIGMLTWFLPIFIPVFIGDINTQYVQKEDKIIPEPTLKMKKHLYWLQLVSFNTLVILNLSLINIIDNKSIKVIVKEWLESSFQTTTNSNFFSTCFILVLSFFISSVLSGLLVWVLKVVYLDKTNGYFAYKKSYIKTNRKFKKNIHKRRT